MRFRDGDGWFEGCEKRFWSGRSLTHYAYAWSYESSNKIHSFVSVVVCMCMAVVLEAEGSRASNHASGVQDLGDILI